MNASKLNFISRFGREFCEAIAELAGDAWGLLRDPKTLKDKMSLWAQQREDSKTSARLNRKIRKQFIKAFNHSANNKMTVEVNCPSSNDLRLLGA